MRRETRSAEAIQWRKWYNTTHWRSLRLSQLASHPLCEMCLKSNHVRPASVVDHKTPHKGSHELFFEPTNLASLCKPHHDSAKQGEEKRGFGGEADHTGWPTDPRHPANQTGRGGSKV